MDMYLPAFLGYLLNYGLRCQQRRIDEMRLKVLRDAKFTWRTHVHSTQHTYTHTLHSL